MKQDIQNATGEKAHTKEFPGNTGALNVIMEQVLLRELVLLISVFFDHQVIVVKKSLNRIAHPIQLECVFCLWLW
jgi:hypothetical protein